jgi:uncharacterized membrane protein
MASEEQTETPDKLLFLVGISSVKNLYPSYTICAKRTSRVSSLWINHIRLVGPFGPIHFLSIFTLVMLPLAVWKAHSHQVAAHRRIMISLFLGALLIAGLFTLLPGRIIHKVVFGA